MRPFLRPRPAGFLALLLAAFTFTLPAAWSQLNDNGDQFPPLSLAKKVRGTDIPTFLNANLPKVAAWYGRNSEELRELCARDHSLHADRKGRLHYVCSGIMPRLPASGQPRATTLSGQAVQSPFPTTQTFKLHSRPGVTKKIYLDFNGHTTTGTYWNDDFTWGYPIVTPRYSEDSNYSSFTSSELEDIQFIWLQVAEDYAPFEVDVTTEDPGVEALRKTSSSDTAYGVRVCVGGSSYDWLGVGAGGIAYLNSFTWNSDTPCFVFADDLWYGWPKYTAEAISHEVGHTFNLNHDGQGSEEYYWGHGNWAPIMGAGYDCDVVQWSKGEYARATNTEDDTAKIAKVAGYRTDKHSDTILNATFLSGNAPASSGIIERRGDADLFGFYTGAGQASFTAMPASTYPNLDVQLSLYDAAGDLITATAPNTMSASLTRTLPQGTYYLCVEGAGAGDPTISYNNYGSLGQFTLSGSVISCTSKPPVAIADRSAPLSGAAPLPVYFSSVGSADSDGSIAAYSWDFGDGTTSTEALPVHTYATPGTYVVSLIVKDNSGLSSPADTVTVTVKKAKVLYVAKIGISIASGSKGYQATAKVTVFDQNGAAKPNATVFGTWSGLTSASASKVTDSAGKAAFASAWTKNHGTFTFTVTNISLSGFSYASGQNVEVQDSIATP